MNTTIKAKKDMHNNGKCFTKGRTYKVIGEVKTEAGLMERMTTNDLQEAHIIGAWWRNFEIIND